MEEQEFVVRDRRIRHEDDAKRPSSDEAPKSAGRTDVPPSSAETPEEGSGASSEPGFSMHGGEEAPIDFSAFVFSLARSALIHMGLETHPEGEKLPLNLKAAQETIDILAMLEDKTRGNLSSEEDELITKLLYTLRVSYVEVAKSRPGEGS